HLDPLLMDPQGLDFRFSPSSPLYSQRSRWPQIRISDRERAAMAEFTAWSGYTPDRWLPLPPP
ncbi:MAG: hypothetical protein MH204_03590, partial [Fimbriimonadaceae bacterium]|nr:hypothetical protein [Fimbriimonadaceae bacterium]